MEDSNKKNALYIVCVCIKNI